MHGVDVHGSKELYWHSMAISQTPRWSIKAPHWNMKEYRYAKMIAWSCFKESLYGWRGVFQAVGNGNYFTAIMLVGWNDLGFLNSRVHHALHRE